MKRILTFIITALSLCIFSTETHAKTINVSKSGPIKTIGDGIRLANEFDTLLVQKGIYSEHDLAIEKPLSILGNDRVVLDIGKKGYGFVILAHNVELNGLTIKNVGKSYTKDFAAIYLSRCKNFTLTNLVLSDVFFGILVEKSHHGIISNNEISSHAVEEAGSGNGIHMWHCSDVSIHNNEVHHLRDGIYFEFVTNSRVTNNSSHHNLRYGLHFMFSNNDEYHYNVFSKNGAGVAVMFSKFIKMTNNTFMENWGSASYGLLLKEIYDAEIKDNTIIRNTIGINAEGATRITYEGNEFSGNGWAIKISGACYTNEFTKNNFLSNSFDVSYNSKLNDNTFDHNFWSDYTGYDLDKDGIGDVPFRPVKLFSYIVNRTPETILLLRSLFVELLNFSEKVSPVFTPDNLKDNNPLMKKIE